MERSKILEKEYLAEANVVAKLEFDDQLKRAEKAVREPLKQPHDTSLYVREWTVKKHEEKETPNDRQQESIRVLQFNILSHGLSNPCNSGFAAGVKDEISQKDFKENDECFATKPVGNFLMSISHKNKHVSQAADTPLPTPKRFNRILSIILAQNPDVITLQELDHHFDLFRPELLSMGYEGVFQRKHISKGAEWNGGLPDGVAVFWNTQKINMIKQVPVGWNGTGSLHDAGFDKKKNKFKYGERAKQVTIAVHLQVKATKHDFLMMTAHVKSGEKPADLPAKVSQGQEVANIIADAGMPVIFACDFNNRPGGDAHNSFFAQLAKRKTNVTSAYSNVLDEWRCVEETDNTIKPERFRNSRDHTRLSDAEKMTPEFCGTIQDPENGQSIQNDDNRICPRCKQKGLTMLAEFSKPHVGQKKMTKMIADLERAKHLLNKKLTQEPEFTSAKWRKGGAQEDKRGITNQTIDYIFYTSEPRGENKVALDCSRVLDLPHEPIEAIYMPGWKYPSDHFCIAADLTFTQKRRRMAQGEQSNRRDSPVMTRLLNEVVDAQDN